MDPNISDARVQEALAGLTFSCVDIRNPLAVLRAAQWFNLAGPLQGNLPFFLVHDVGLALSYGASRQVTFRPATPLLEEAVRRRLLDKRHLDDAPTAAYVRLLSSLGKCSLAERMGTGGLSDPVMGALVAKILEPIRDALGNIPRAVQMPLTPSTYEDVDPLLWLTKESARQSLDMIARLAERTTQVHVAAEQVDLDTLKLMHMMGGPDAEADSSSLLDFYRVLESPQAHDIVDFCLDLVPQILETSRSRGAQTFAMGGYASIETKGNLDSLLPSELAYDDALFEQRWSENELLFFGREKDTRERQRLHYILVDASAAMRGLRTAFARGLAIALAKKLLLRGEQVWLRFFDSRLHERLEMTTRSMRLPHILSFRSELGRNAPRVFDEVDVEVGRLVREEGRDVLVTFITHGRLSVPEATLEKLRQKAHVFGVFVLPSQELELPYLKHLTRSHVVDASALEDPQARTAAAMKVLQGS